MPAFRSIRLWYWCISLLALLATGCATSCREKVVEHPIPHLYGTEDPQFSRTMGTLLGMGILEGNQVDVLLNGDGIVRMETKTPIRRSTSLQSIPQYVEVPPNLEAKRIISYFSAVLSD